MRMTILWDAMDRYFIVQIDADHHIDANSPSGL